MKRITKYIGLALAVSAFAASCNKNAEPVFNDKDAFVAFNSQTLSVSEDYSKDGDNFKIPVTLASVKGLETTVKFEVTSLTAKAGVNFSLETTSGVLSFDAENRTSYIEIKTLPDGIFTVSFICTTGQDYAGKSIPDYRFREYLYCYHQ